MNKNWRKMLQLSAAVTVTLLSSGCIVENHPAPQPHPVYVQQSPPADLYEQVPPRPPGPYWAWQKGHWRWNGHQYFWTPGHWKERPPQYNMWVAPHWEPRNSGYFFVEGRWQ